MKMLTGVEPGVAQWWDRISLAWKFTLVSSSVLLLGILLQATWVSSKIEKSVKYDAASAATLYMEILVAPHFEGLVPGRPLARDVTRALDYSIQTSGHKVGIISAKIWSPDGLVLYASQGHLTGRWFPPGDDLREAASGKVAANFLGSGSEESRWEQAQDFPLMEVYLPVRDSSGKVIAVAEFYSRSEHLSQTITESKWEMIGVSFATSVVIIVALFWLVAQGSDIIERQKRALIERVIELSNLLRQNEELRFRVQESAQYAAEDNQRFLRSLGADLHDGPAQLIGLALLRLDSLRPARDTPGLVRGNQEDVVAIRSALQDTMKDVRSLCAGLCMAEIQTLSLDRALAYGIRDHELRTRTRVRSEFVNLPAHVPHFVKICLSRLIQEGLNNAFKHAGGLGQSVRAWVEDNLLFVEVGDEGPGFQIPADPERCPHFGLTNLRGRVENLGGSFRVDSKPGKGTRLCAALPIMEGSPS
jgi:signal transduction histidine kinase